MRLPPVHLSINELEEIEEIMRGKTTNCNIEVTLSLSGGIDQSFHSTTQINSDLLLDTDGSSSYTISVTGEEGKCEIGGESAGRESHMVYCVGDSEWKNEIQNELKEYLTSVQTLRSRLRNLLSGRRATIFAVIISLSVGWALSGVAPQSVITYYPTLWDAFLLFSMVFVLLLIKYRNWVHPYILIGYDYPYPTKRNTITLIVISSMIVYFILVIRGLTEPGPFLR